MIEAARSQMPADLETELTHGNRRHRNGGLHHCERHLQRQAECRHRSLALSHRGDARCFRTRIRQGLRVQHADQLFRSGEDAPGPLLRRSLLVLRSLQTDVLAQRRRAARLRALRLDHVGAAGALIVPTGVQPRREPELSNLKLGCPRAPASTKVFASRDQVRRSAGPQR